MNFRLMRMTEHWYVPGTEFQKTMLPSIQNFLRTNYDIDFSTLQVFLKKFINTNDSNGAFYNYLYIMYVKNRK